MYHNPMRQKSFPPFVLILTPIDQNSCKNFMTSWHKEEEEAIRRRATKRGSEGSTTDLEPPPTFICTYV